MMARRRGISPEDRFTREGEDAPDVGLTEEPARMGSEWRKDFYPEDYIEEGHGNLNKLLAFKSKEGRCQAKSKREDSHLIHLSYESMVRITARRLAKSGYPTQGRPNKPLYEEFKEKFFWRRNYKGPDQRAWFFYHVHEVLNNLKERTKMANWRPWLDPEIDLAKSSDEEEDFLQDPWVVEDDSTGSFNMAMPPGQRLVEEKEDSIMPRQRDDKQRRKREADVTTSNFLRQEDESEHHYQFSDVGQEGEETTTYRQEQETRRETMVPEPRREAIAPVVTRVVPNRQTNNNVVQSPSTSSLSMMQGPGVGLQLARPNNIQVATNLFHTPSNSTPASPARTPETLVSTSSKVSESNRRRNHSKIKFSAMDCTEASIDTFVNEVRNFETDEGSLWNRGNLSLTTQGILRSQWTNWEFRDHDTDWKSTPSLKFFEFMKAVHHSYFPYSTPDSSYVEAVTSIVQVLEIEPI